MSETPIRSMAVVTLEDEEVKELIRKYKLVKRPKPPQFEKRKFLGILTTGRECIYNGVEGYPKEFWYQQYDYYEDILDWRVSKVYQEAHAIIDMLSVSNVLCLTPLGVKALKVLRSIREEEL